MSDDQEMAELLGRDDVRAGFGKHYYELPADMNKEEAECAACLDSLAEVKCWVRNLERDDYAFWLQTSTDKFYPDYVCL